MEATTQRVFGHNYTEREILEIKQEVTQEAATVFQVIKEEQEIEGRKKEAELNEKVGKAVIFIKFFENGYFDLWKFFNNNLYRIIPDDQKEFIRRVNQGLESLRGRVPKRKVYIIRNSDNKEVQIEEVENLTEGAFSIKSKKLIKTKH